MGNRQTILMLLLGIVVCLALLWYARQRDVSFAEAARNVSVLGGRTPGAVDRLTVEREGLYLDVRRQRHGWEMYLPFAASLDQGAVAQLLDAVEQARASDVMRFSEMNRRNLTLGDLGLAPPAARVTFHGAGWSSTLLVGRPTPSGNEVFVRDVGMETIWSVPAAVASRLPAAADDWRSRDLAAGDRTRLRLLEVRAPGKPFIRLSKETGTWRLLQPADGPADDRKVEALLDALYAGKAVRFVWPSVSSSVTGILVTESELKSRMEIYGLGPDAALQVTVQESANAAPVKVAFGNRCDGEDNLRYVLMPGGNTVAAASNAVFDAFQRAPADLRDMRLFSERPQNVKRLEIAADNLLLVLAQKDAQWQMESPVLMRMDQGRVMAALDQLLRLTAETISDGADTPPPDADAAALPVSQIELQTDSGAFRVAFMREDTEGQSYCVTMTNNPVVYHVASSNVPPAFLGGQAALGLCDRVVLSLTNGAIRRVTVKRSDGTSEALQRDGVGDTGWRTTAEAREIDTRALEAFLAKVSSLTVDRIEKPFVAPSGADPYEFKTPWLEITLDVDAADAIRKTIIIGKEAPGDGRYATIRGHDAIFILSAETLDTLEKTLFSN